MDLKFNNRDPVYVQVVQHFKQQIAVGLLEPGQTIPSRRELATMLKINPNTAQRAYKEMEDAGLIQTESNLPSTVTRDPDIIQAARDGLIKEAVEQFVESLQTIGVTKDVAVRIVEEAYARRDRKRDET